MMPAVAAIAIAAVGIGGPVAPVPRPVTLIATGDICLADSIAARCARSGRGWPFDPMRRALQGADIAVGNLECVLARGGRPIPNKRFALRGDPSGALALREAGFDLVTLANNHSLDFGKPALVEMLGNLAHAAVPSCGAGRNRSEAHTLRILTVRGLRVGFLAYLGMFPPPLPLPAREPGVAMADIPPLQADIRAARPQVDILIVALHAGIERRRSPSPRQQSIAHAAIDAGADMVIGHHPHVVQPMERYRGRPIVYSLGNFVFHQSPQCRREGGRGWSAVAVASLRRGAPPEVKVIPVQMVDGRPMLPPSLAPARSRPVAAR